MNFESVDRLNEVLEALKQTFVGKNEILDLMGVCLVARENLFLLGPPGTAKSAMVRELAKQVQGKTFEYLLTRFTEPNELFGPFDIRKLREGDLVTNTEGMLPEAELIFLDELLNANSAILNSLLMVLNERVFRRGRETKSLPALMIVGASNQLPEDEALQALFDRFLVRVRCDNVDPQSLNRVLEAGWALEQREKTETVGLAASEIRSLQQATNEVDLTPIQPLLIELVQQLRNAGVKLSDRRAVKLQRLIAASALICKRTTAQASDLWVLRYIWDVEEQREIIAGIVQHGMKDQPAEGLEHPQSNQNQLPDADKIYEEVLQLREKWLDLDLPMSERSIIKDRLRYLDGRIAWITNESQREYVQKPVDDLWREIIGRK